MGLVEWKGLPERERERLFARLTAVRKTGGDGKPRYADDPFFDDVIGVLESALEFADEVPETEARRSVGAALFAEGSEALNAEDFLRNVERHVAAFLDTEPCSYVLVGSILARHFEELGETEISECRLAFHRHVPAPFQRGYQWAEDRTRNLVPGNRRAPDLSGLRSTAVTVEAEGRSESEAALKAQRALTLQRGIWNLALYRHAPPAGSSGSLNHILPGPVQSLHHPAGEVLRWPVFYEPEFVKPTGMLHVRRLERHWDDVREYERLAREGLAGSHYPCLVEGFVRDYVRILDGRDSEAAFIGLWGLLERLVGLEDGERHTVVTKRAAFLVKSELRKLQYLVVESLRRQRNAGVHQGVFPSDAQHLLRQLRRFVALAVEFHLDERFGFSDPKEATRFLSQPSEEGSLRQRIRSLQWEGRGEELRLARMALHYHGHAP